KCPVCLRGGLRSRLAFVKKRWMKCFLFCKKAVKKHLLLEKLLREKECILMVAEARARVAVFASGAGTNFEAIMHHANRDFDVVMLICDVPKAHVIGKAAGLGVETVVLDPKTYPSKVDYEKEIITKLKRANVEWIVLSGYMRIVGETLLTAYENKIVNVHPSLLPSFPGKDAVGQALDAGVKVSGVTIHYVDAGVDTGPIIAQEPVSVFPNDTGDSLQKRIQQVEHVLYTRIINDITKG